MKKQTTDEKICRLCNFYNPNTKGGLCEYCQKAIKEGRLSALADVEKIVDKFAFPVTMGWDRKENINEVSKSRKELKQEIAKLKGKL